MADTENDITLKLKQARVILVLNLLTTFFCFTSFLKSLDTHVLWKIICSGAGLICFSALSTALFLRVKALKKQVANLEK